ncbi:hypothetical protein ISN45_Aa04g001580 [Arabidopsis thaliana x Arabidopsis arenosa]|uniref:Uncharacterized protein n=1 Tax=Arabidopsis thaliana x Arabidopsis arenosa TaxID=1240361 RepID=A0A8T2A175_9BRAS|nr:hypothetical protein ISN45_Aa04g001580 [Arabidopsis thaliana x Arabidopsis arenosa]
MGSMEALAMAGVSYQEWGLSIEEWELQESVVPPHLIADDFEEEELRDNDDDDRVLDGLAAKQSVTCDIRASVGKLIEQSISHMIVHLKQLKFLTLLLENFLFSHVLDFLL